MNPYYIILTRFSMFCHRQFLIEQQLLKNRTTNKSRKPLLYPNDLKHLLAKAKDELTVSKIKSGELDFNTINQFLILADPNSRSEFFNHLRQAIQLILADPEKCKIFQEKWSSGLRHNVLKLFATLSKQIMGGQSNQQIDWKKEIVKINSIIMEKVMREEKIWRVEEKLVDAFITESLQNLTRSRLLLNPHLNSLATLANSFAATLQIPKTFTNLEYIRFGILRILDVDIPSQHTLHNQLVQAPNPKLLLPLATKRSFFLLTQQMLLKLNKVDMVSLKYWSMFQYEQSEIYEKVKKAQGWETKVEVILLGIKHKLKEGLLKYMTYINETILKNGVNVLSDDAINQLTSYTEIIIEILDKHSEPQIEQIALEKVDIGLALNYKKIMDNLKQKEFILKILEVYLRLIIACPKPKVKIRFIKDITTKIYLIVRGDKDDKLTKQLSLLLNRIFPHFTSDEKEEFFIQIVKLVNANWVEAQGVSKSLVKVEPNVLFLLAELISRYDMTYFNKNKLTILQFLLILAFNEDEKNYYECKSSFCYLRAELSYSLTGSSVFNFLTSNSQTLLLFRKRLQQKYGGYNFERHEFEGLLGIIDEMVIFRITGFMDRIASSLPLKDSYFSVLIQFIEETEKLSTDLNVLVMKYFATCVRTYMLQLKKAKRTDEYKQRVRQILKKDISYLIQSSASANPLVKVFSRNCLTTFIEQIPQIAFHTQVLRIFSEVISFLYVKVTQEYQSKSQTLKGKNLHAGILIPNNISEISERLGSVMIAVYQVILRGHCIDDTYLKLRISYLIREENAYSTDLTFGYKFLRHLVNNFREDRDFIEREVLLGNACLWWINEVEFNQRVKCLKPDKFLLDKSLIALHNSSSNPSMVKNIVLSVKPQIQTEYLIIPPQSGEKQMLERINQLNSCASELEKMNLFQTDEEVRSEVTAEMFRVVGNMKMLNLSRSHRLQMLSKLLDVCKRWTNAELLQYILSKLVPFLYCVGGYNSDMLAILAQTIHYLTIQLNKYSRFQPIQRVSEQDIFSLKLDFLYGIEQYEEQEISSEYESYLNQLKKSRGFEILAQKYPNSRPAVIKAYDIRFNNLKKMHKSILTTISRHNQVTLAKGIKLSLLSTILSQNIKLNRKVLQFIPLQTICYALKSQLQYVNVMKALIEKDGPVYDIASVNYFYYKTLKMGLYHFQKQSTFYQQQLLVRSGQIEDLSAQITTFIQVCNHLRNQDLHKISNNKLKTKKDDIFSRTNNRFNLKVDRLKRTEKSNYVSYPTNSNKKKKDEGDEVTVELPIFRFMLLYLISEHIDRVKSFSYNQLVHIVNPYSLRGKKNFIKNQEVMQLLEHLGRKALVLIYNITRTFTHCLENPQAIFEEIRRRLSDYPHYDFPEFLPLFIEENKDNQHRLRQINYWNVPHIQLLLKYLTYQYDGKPELQLYVTKILGRLHSEQLLFYLPQMNQALSLRSGELISKFFLDYSERSTLFAHQVIWIFKVQAKQEIDPHNKTKRSREMEEHLQRLHSKSNELIDMTIQLMDKQKKTFFNSVNDFFEVVTSISGALEAKMPSEFKRNIIQQKLTRIEVTPDIYLPTNPRYQVDSIKLDSGIPMQSAAKCPILVTFYCNKYAGPDDYFQKKMMEKKQKRLCSSNLEIEDDHRPLKIPQSSSILKQPGRTSISLMKKGLGLDDINMEFDSKQKSSINSKASMYSSKRQGGNPMLQTQLKIKDQRTEVSCIFKVFDDIRQDSLALQIIRLFMEIFEKNNLDLYLYPYKTISNRTGTGLNIGGIIECVPNTISRDGIGKINQQSLYQYFINKFGPQHNINFQQARDNFIKSQAAYSLVSYFLQIKDRHNGNILINNEGYIIHIDFGFIFDISPANNLKFQSANFKLTKEMIEIMGGSIKSEPFQSYMNMIIRAFLVIRKYHEHVINTVKLMSLSGLPCFLPQTMENLKNRFVLNYNDSEAADYMRDIILDAADKWTTNWYDRIQWLQQKIYH